MKDGTRVDFTTTTKRVGSRHAHGRGKLAVCPKCGRKGDRTQIQLRTGGKASFVHAKVFRGWCWQVEDYCLFSLEEEARLKASS